MKKYLKQSCVIENLTRKDMFHFNQNFSPFLFYDFTLFFHLTQKNQKKKMKTKTKMGWNFNWNEDFFTKYFESHKIACKDL